MSRKKSILFIMASGLLVLWLTIVSSAFATSKERVLYSFCAQQLCPDGSNPVSSLVFDRAGNLYGTAVYGGNSNCVHGCGTVFKLMQVKGKWKQKVLHHFENNGKDGYYPTAALIFDPAGNLYGTTAAGGSYQVGAVFELMPGADGKWKEKILHSFKGSSSDGSDPLGPVIFDTRGSLYGTTFYGGANGDGIVFSLKPDKNDDWTERVLHNFIFNGKDGFSSRAAVVFDNSGNFYGTTVLGGTGGNGTVFEEARAKKGSWTEKVLYSFTGGADGSLAVAGLTIDKNGNLYGTTLAGGASGYGNVFTLAPGKNGGWTFTTILSFDQVDGESPDGVLISDSAGNLYGATSGGGAYNSDCSYPGCGTVFKLTPGSGGTWTETVLHSFNSNGVDGYNPEAGLIMDTGGNLYGTTNAGGAYGYGTVFEVTP
ncbi:MAG TPA: choice-of-anchor tandem repeat GloVer-containing protein [Terriglobales bacterium]|jgi:uncharacterized repeat protein (TIGR03803 family)|nr:choice-of-anchor tandem repeat GloVer-containing protein [Terriglobales bacterium]